MSRSLVVYSVDFGKVVDAAGARDAALLARIAPKGTDPSLARAAAELVEVGVPPFRAGKAELAFAQEAICRALGRALDNSAVCAASLSTLERIDAELAPLGLGVTLETLMYGGGPIQSLPWPDDFPSCGRWSAADVARASAQYRALSPSHPDPDVADVLVAIDGWLEIAAERGEGLAGFYY